MGGELVNFGFAGLPGLPSSPADTDSSRRRDSPLGPRNMRRGRRADDSQGGVCRTRAPLPWGRAQLALASCVRMRETNSRSLGVGRKPVRRTSGAPSTRSRIRGASQYDVGWRALELARRAQSSAAVTGCAASRRWPQARQPVSKFHGGSPAIRGVALPHPPRTKGPTARLEQVEQVPPQPHAAPPDIRHLRCYGRQTGGRTFAYTLSDGAAPFTRNP